MNLKNLPWDMKDLPWLLLLFAALIVETIQHFFLNDEFYPFLKILFFALFSAAVIVNLYVRRKK